jgi:ribosomal protein S18 acetylase RimI-like enzyme
MSIVRPAVAADAEAIALLLGQLGYPTAPEDIPALITSIEREQGIVLVAVNDDHRVIGLASGSRQTTLHAGDQVAYITALVTDRDERRRGVGRMLVSELE